MLGISPKANFAYAAKQFTKGRITGQICAKRRGAGMERSDVISSSLETCKDWRGYYNIFLPAIAGEQDLESSQQRHEQIDILLLAQAFEGYGSLMRQNKGVAALSISLLSNSPPVGR